MPVTSLCCVVTGIKFKIDSLVKPIKDKSIHPSLYGFDLVTLVNILSGKLKRKEYDFQGVEVSRLLLIHALWNVGIQGVSLSPILYGDMDEDDIRYEYILALENYDDIPEGRFNLTRLEDKNPWQKLNNVLKTYGVVVKKIDPDSFENWLQINYDDNLSEIVCLIEDRLLRSERGTLPMLERIELKSLVLNLPTDYLSEVIDGNLDKNAIRMRQFLKNLEKLSVKDERLLDY